MLLSPQSVFWAGMASYLFSCCWPGGKRNVSTKTTNSSQPERNGLVDVGAGGGYGETQQTDGLIRDAPVADLSYAGESHLKVHNMAEAGEPEGSHHDPVTVKALVAASRQSKKCVMAPASQVVGKSTRATNIDASGFIHARPIAQKGGHEEAARMIRLPVPATGIRSAGPRVAHAHPNDHPQAMVAGADSKRMSSRGRAQVLGVGRPGGGRFGTAAYPASGAMGVQGRAGRGIPRPIPGASGSLLAKYELREMLGVGSTSKCYRCVNRLTRKQFACKVRTDDLQMTTVSS